MKYQCEHGNCPNEATTEWKKRDEDGTYYTLRCTGHPVSDQTYTARQVK
jgi:hypothetical protein